MNLHVHTFQIKSYFCSKNFVIRSYQMFKKSFVWVEGRHYWATVSIVRDTTHDDKHFFGSNGDKCDKKQSRTDNGNCRKTEGLGNLLKKQGKTLPYLLKKVQLFWLIPEKFWRCRQKLVVQLYLENQKQLHLLLQIFGILNSLVINFILGNFCWCKIHMTQLKLRKTVSS